MESFTVSRSSLSSLSVEEKTWAIKFLADNLAQAQKPSRKKHSSAVRWSDYKVSPEVMAMTVANRKEVAGDVEDKLTELLEKKYR